MKILCLYLPVLSELLRIIRCNCQADCGNMRCTCKKHNVKCSVTFGNCRMSGCSNSEIIIDDDNSKGSSIIFSLYARVQRVR